MNNPHFIAQGLRLRIIRLLVRKGASWLLYKNHLLKLHCWLREAEMAGRR